MIANDIEAHRELIRTDVNGLLVDFSDEERAAEVVVQALRLPAAHLAGIGERARAAAARFGWDLVVDRVERVYRESATAEARG